MLIGIINKTEKIEKIMTKKILLLVGISSIALSLTACGTSPQRIDATGNEGIVSIDQVNFKDWQIAAEKGITISPEKLMSGAMAVPAFCTVD
jgi:hypothetical protein